MTDADADADADAGAPIDDPDHWRRRARAFGAVAERYDQMRPSYPDALFDDVLAPGDVARVLEVGAGTGKATVGFARRGVAVTALEPDPEMGAVARRVLAPYPAVRLVASSLEDWDGPAGGVDVVAAGQSWHWVDPVAGPAAAARALRPGGRLAAFWNTPDPERTPLFDELQSVYQRCAPGLVETTVATRGSRRPGQFQRRMAGATDFERTERHDYRWETRYTTEEFVGLQSTHSDHLILPADELDALTRGLRAMVDAHGGALQYAYKTSMLVAVRRP